MDAALPQESVHLFAEIITAIQAYNKYAEEYNASSDEIKLKNIPAPTQAVIRTKRRAESDDSASKRTCLSEVILRLRAIPHPLGVTKKGQTSSQDIYSCLKRKSLDGSSPFDMVLRLKEKYGLTEQAAQLRILYMKGNYPLVDNPDLVLFGHFDENAEGLTAVVNSDGRIVLRRVPFKEYKKSPGQFQDLIDYPDPELDEFVVQWNNNDEHTGKHAITPGMHFHDEYEGIGLRSCSCGVFDEFVNDN